MNRNVSLNTLVFEADTSTLQKIDSFPFVFSSGSVINSGDDFDPAFIHEPSVSVQIVFETARGHGHLFFRIRNYLIHY